MILSLVTDGLVAILLAVTIFYCFHLDRKLRALRSGKDELKQVIAGLTDATLRAQQSVVVLKQSGQSVSEELTSRVSNARNLRDELELMLEAGNNLADRLEASRPGAKSVEESPKLGLAALNGDPIEAEEIGEFATEDRTRREASLESELLKALRQAR